VNGLAGVKVTAGLTARPSEPHRLKSASGIQGGEASITEDPPAPAFLLPSQDSPLRIAVLEDAPAEPGGPGYMADVAAGLAFLEDEGQDEDEEHPLTATRRTVLAMLAWALEDGWPGRGGATDFYAYLAFLNAAYRANKLIVGMSQYQLALAIGKNSSTAWRVMRRLERRGLIEAQGDGHRRTTPRSGEKPLAVSYLLMEALNRHRRITHGTSLPSSFEAKSNADMPDAFRGRGGFSTSRRRSYDALDYERAQTAEELAGKLKRDPSTIRKILKGLEKSHLARRTPDGWVKGDADLEEVARDLRTAGAGKRQRAYYESLRKGYLAFLQHKDGAGEERLPAQDVQPERPEVVSRAGAAVSGDERTGLREAGPQPVQHADGPRVPPTVLGERRPDLASPPGREARRQALQLPRGEGVTWEPPAKHPATCVGCGQVQDFSAPDLRPYSCAYCGGKFKWVDDLAEVELAA
jgi:DNA-binding MarR family transcriptional regulator